VSKDPQGRNKSYHKTLAKVKGYRQTLNPISVTWRTGGIGQQDNPWTYTKRSAELPVGHTWERRRRDSLPGVLVPWFTRFVPWDNSGSHSRMPRHVSVAGRVRDRREDGKAGNTLNNGHYTEIPVDSISSTGTRRTSTLLWRAVAILDAIARKSPS
jgi:hypothetical protein